MNYKEREKIAKNFVKWMFEEMPTSKKKNFNMAATRNLYLTSEYTLRNARFTVYKEGWYIEMEGCRSRLLAMRQTMTGSLYLPENRTQINCINFEGLILTTSLFFPQMTRKRSILMKTAWIGKET